LPCVAVCCRVLPCVAVCCRVLPCVAVCCSVLQCVAVCCQFYDVLSAVFVSVTYRVLPCVAVCVQYVSLRCNALLKMSSLYRVAKMHRCCILQVYFHKRANNYRALWRKETCKNKASYASLPPCNLRCVAVRCRVLHCVMVLP